MTQLIFPFLLLFLSLNSYCQQNKSIISSKVILSNQENTLNNNDSISSPGPRTLTISIVSDNYQLTEAEYSITIKRGKANVTTVSGKGKEISLVNIGAIAQSKDILIVEIKKLKISTPGVILKPSNGLFRIYLK